jgi:hypothetical protein
MSDWQKQKAEKCGCKGSDDMCGCQNNAPITEPRRMPDEMMAWPSNVTASGQIAITGGWSANQHFNDEAVRYVRDDLPPTHAQIIASPEVQALMKALGEARRAIGDHFAPMDCYTTGPLTGDWHRDMVECPACAFIAAHDAALAQLKEPKP